MDSELIYSNTDIRRYSLCGLSYTPVGIYDLHNYIRTTIRHRRHGQILNINVHAVNLAYNDHEFREILNRGDILFCDGAGIQLGAWLLGHPVPPRITYADWMWQLAEFAAREGFSIYLLGARPGVANRAAQKLVERFPALRIAGAHHGYFDKYPDSTENQQVIAQINQAQPDILLVCFGMPHQEKWLAANWDVIEARVALTGGAALDYVSGELRRGPKWMTDHGLEWLARMIIEPSRLWKRYLVGNPLFISRILAARLKGKHANSDG